MDLQIVFGNPKQKSNKKSGGLMAKKKPAKKAVKKAAKKATKKPATKPAKKATKKVAKKASKKVAKKASKKVAKKATKKVAKKATKKVAKKATKKVAKKASKKVAKKVTKKVATKKAVAKKKPVAKGPNRKGRSKIMASMDVGTAGLIKAPKTKRRKGKKSNYKLPKKSTTIKVGDKRVKNIRKNRSKAMATMDVGRSRSFNWASFGAKRGKMKSSRHGGTRGKGGLNKAFYHKHKVFRKNPMGGQMKQAIEKYSKHKLTEAAGLAIGGFTSEAINNVVLTKMPQLASFMGRWFGRGTGAAINAVVGVTLGIANEKLMKNNAQVDMLAKGIIGSAAVTAGNALYAMTLGRSAMGSFHVGDSRISRFQTDPSTDFGGFVTGNSNMGSFIYGDSGMGSNADFSGVDFSGYDYDDSDYDSESEGEYSDGY